MSDPAILVTGAGRRIGLHIAQRLHQDGHTVIAHYRTLTAEIEALAKQGVRILQADFTDSDTIFSFLDQLTTLSTDFRAVIHNASAFAPTDPDPIIAAAQYQHFFAIHMLAPYLINQRLQAHLTGEADNPADIIHITDINADNPTAQFDIYSATKAGLQNLTLSLAKQYAPEIKVNAIAPGPVLFAPQHSDTTRQAMLAETYLREEGGAEPVYLAIKSLLDNPFITGISIPVDGGRRLSKR
jgi:dihydromonapterin reductase/dihydrofolate reductase